MTSAILMFLCIQALLLQYSRSEGGPLNNDKIPCGTKNVEDYLDKILKNVTSQIPNPIRLPDHNRFLKLTNGELFGFTTLKHDGSAIIECNRHFLIITANLKVDELTGRYRWSKQLIRRKLSGLIVIMSKIFEVKIKLRQENKPNAYLNLDMFKITKMEGIDVEFTGLEYITWFMSKLIDPIAELFKKLIARILERQIRESLVSALSLISIPLE